MNEPWNTYNGEPPMSLLEGGTNEMPMIDNQPPMSLMPTSEPSMPQSPFAQIMLQNIAKKAIAQLQMQQARQKMEQEVASMPSGADERTRQTIANMRAMKESGLFDSPYRKHPIMMGIGSVLAGIGQGMTGQPYLDSALNRMDEQAKNIATLAKSGEITPEQQMYMQARIEDMASRREMAKQQFDAIQQQRTITNEIAKQGLDIRKTESEANRDLRAAMKDITVGQKEDQFRAKRISDMGNDLDWNKNVRSAYGVTAQNFHRAERLEGLVNQYKDLNIDQREMEELAIGLNALLQGSNQSAMAQVRALLPKSAVGNAMRIKEWLQNNPQGLNQQAFVQRMLNDVIREKNVMYQQLIRDAAKKISKYPDVRKKTPEEWANNLKQWGINPEDYIAWEKGGFKGDFVNVVGNNKPNASNNSEYNSYLNAIGQ